MLYINPGVIYTPEHLLDNGALLVEKGRIVAVGTVDQIPCPEEARRIDAAELILTPGFIDLQLNGGFGHDFTAEPGTIWSVARHLPCHGVTAFLPTIVSSPAATVVAAQRVLAQGPPPVFSGARPLGLHVEGPFLNPAKKGAHNPAYLRTPNLEATANWSPEQNVRLVTVAPELDGATEVIVALAERGVVVSAGHSLADYDQALGALAAGLRYGTHLFNAMPPLEHRLPGLPGALLTDPRATVGLIPDGIHVHPAVVSLVWQILGNKRLTLVTDAMAALGMPPGIFRIGEFEVTVDHVSARLADGTLAGSILSLDAALRNLMAFTGCSLQEALPTVTTTPARLLGLGGRLGKIAPGYAADFVFFDKNLRVKQTIVAGQVVYPA
jgi:N-acetylglucosamine-6-phosphate deacetylase